jgi:hypothetical protein
MVAETVVARCRESIKEETPHWAIMAPDRSRGPAGWVVAVRV